jgi:pyroglutamyl-peptidase
MREIVAAELKVLVTGFVPFGGDAYNASGVTARWLDGQSIPTRALIVGKGDVPVVAASQGAERSGADAVIAAIDACRPDIVVCLGQGEAATFRVELEAHDPPDPPTAVRAPSAREAVRGAVFHDPRISRDPGAGYRATYASTLDAARVVTAIAAAGGDARTSTDAGMFVCEDVLYHVLRHLQGRAPALTAGFIHVPRRVRVDTPVDALLEDDDPVRDRPDYDGTGLRPFTPNDAGATLGERYVAQSLINAAIYRAIAAAVAGVLG